MEETSSKEEAWYLLKVQEYVNEIQNFYTTIFTASYIL
jgi:hypothetical protein